MRKPFDGEFAMTQAFGGNPQDYVQFGLAGHNGVDWALPMGTPVLAAADGMVEDVGYDAGGYGYYITLVHDGGVRTVYGHLSRALMSRGDNVSEGQAIGKSGNTGNSTGPHLHWTVKVPGQGGNGYRGAVDPLGYLAGEPPSPQPSPGKGEGAQTRRMVVQVDGLRVRSGAGTSYQEMGRGAAGSAVEVAEVWARRADGQGWMAVYYNGDELMR